eukprot:TRINITY_DN21443_c0_g1_i1.p2 TRINITY_DN21443_c0_g1~~TRINITY_DN21443_c0_g1_i1.p2  ORF type:complete len:156 (+),score=57.36 TRINITY_DN21443_c0_g1_i1:88-555(+)
MSRFPHCKTFISVEAPQYPGLEVKRMPGKAPVVYWLDAEGAVLGETAIGMEDTVQDIAQLFEQHGIRKQPAGAPEGFVSTEACKAFRAIGSDGQRLPGGDAACTATLHPASGSGFCECNGGLQNVDIRQAEERGPFTCETACILQRAPWVAAEEL